MDGWIQYLLKKGGKAEAGVSKINRQEEADGEVSQVVIRFHRCTVCMHATVCG